MLHPSSEASLLIHWLCIVPSPQHHQPSCGARNSSTNCPSYSRPTTRPRPHSTFAAPNPSLAKDHFARHLPLRSNASIAIVTAIRVTGSTGHNSPSLTPQEEAPKTHPSAPMALTPPIQQAQAKDPQPHHNPAQTASSAVSSKASNTAPPPHHPAPSDTLRLPHHLLSLQTPSADSPRMNSGFCNKQPRPGPPIKTNQAACTPASPGPPRHPAATSPTIRRRSIIVRLRRSGSIRVHGQWGLDHPIHSDNNPSAFDKNRLADSCSRGCSAKSHAGRQFIPGQRTGNPYCNKYVYIELVPISNASLIDEVATPCAKRQIFATFLLRALGKVLTPCATNSTRRSEK